MDKWHGIENPEDGHYPEEWIASTTKANDINPSPEEGLSKFEMEDGSEILLNEIINSYPEAFLGHAHVEKYGSKTAILVKLIDSSNRLLIQVHPDKEYAKTFLGSGYGKTEAWYVLDSRIVDGQKPYVLLGFKPGITKDKWRDIFARQEKREMENALHRFNVKPGEVYLIGGGVPHALGAGCFIMEIQEPTDYTMRVERTSHDGRPIPDYVCHQGVGFDKMFDCFHYESYSREGTQNRYRINPSIIREEKGGRETSLISYENTSYFAMNKIEVAGSYKSKQKGTFSVAVILSGQGKLLWQDKKMDIKQTDQIFLPAGLGDVTWQCIGEKSMEIVMCHPPK